MDSHEDVSGGYVPQTEGEWRIAMWQELRAAASGIREIRDIVKDHERRINELESDRDTRNGASTLFKWLVGVPGLSALFLWFGSHIRWD